MLFTLQINPDRGHQAIPRKELAVDHQHQQILGHRPLHQPFQLFSRGGFPVATDARTLDAIALQATLNCSLIVPTRALARQLSSYRFLQFSIPLKGSITGQADLFVLTAAQPGSLQGHFAPPDDQFTHRQLSFQAQSFPISCFFFGLLILSDVLSHRWFSWLTVSFCNRPSCLMGGRRTTSNFNYRRDISPAPTGGSGGRQPVSPRGTIGDF